MVYSTDAAKWRAYQFLDPFAAGSFFVCNQMSKYFCRPDCDAYPMTELRLEIKFVSSVGDAVELGYVPCDSCDPILVPPVDVDLLVATVRDINHTIGFLPPEEEEDKDRADPSQRRLLVPAIGYHGEVYDRDTHHASKNDSEHCKLVDLACRHLALAAALSIFSAALASSSPKLDASPDDKKSRKRRGGVLGFKELAAKSKLSAWHFHRVFKSVTGLTPKTYGDRCYDYLQKRRDEGRASVTTFASAPASAPASISAPASASTSTSAPAPAAAASSSSAPASVSAPVSAAVAVPATSASEGVSAPALFPHTAAYASSTSTSTTSSVSEKSDFKPYSSPSLWMTSLMLPQLGSKRVRMDDEMPASKRLSKHVATPVLTPFNEFATFEEDNAFGFDLRVTSAPDLTAYSDRAQSSFATKAADFYPVAEPIMSEFMPQAPNLMEPLLLEEFGGAGYSTDMFAVDEFSVPEYDVTDTFTYGLLPELLMNAGL